MQKVVIVNLNSKPSVVTGNKDGHAIIEPETLNGYLDEGWTIQESKVVIPSNTLPISSVVFQLYKADY